MTALLLALISVQDDLARQARELVERLRSEKIEEREEAARKLKGHQVDVVRWLSFPQEASDPFNGLWKPIDLELHDVDALEALERLFQKAGGHLKLGDLPSKKISLSLKGATYWQAIDEICRQHGGLRHRLLDFYMDYDHLEAGPWVECPVLYRGPLRLYVYDIARVHERRFPGRLDRTDVAIALRWTQDFNLVRGEMFEAGQTRMTRVEDDKGKSLFPETAVPKEYDFNPGGSFTKQGWEWLFRLQPASPGARTLARLEGEWEGSFLAEVEEVVFAKPGESVGSERKIGPMTLTLKSFDAEANPLKSGETHYTATLRLSCDLERAPEDWKRGLKLVPLGRRILSEVRTGPGEKDEGFAWPGKEVSPGAAEFSVWLHDRSAAPRELSVRIGRNVSSARVPFAFKDVPLPADDK